MNASLLPKTTKKRGKGFTKIHNLLYSYTFRTYKSVYKLYLDHE